MEPGIAEALARGLHEEGIVAIVAPGSGPGVRRVLIGPITDTSKPGIRAQLDAHGLHSFFKKYQENTPPEPPRANE